FTSRLTLLLAMVGVAVGLGNVWRFPYMVGRFGGAAFVAFYLALALVVGAPALMAEWTLGRHTRRGTVGAFARAGVRGGRALGWIFFVGVTAATGYYCAAIGWVVAHAIGELVRGAGGAWSAARVLPPESGLDPAGFGLQAVATAAVMGACALVLVRGVRRGIERVSTVATPLLFVILIALALRALTLPGAGAGLDWYLLKFAPGDLNARVAMAALGQVIFSLALGGTFMVVYGSYLPDDVDLRANAAATVAGDTLAGLLAGLAIFPAVFALGLEPASGPGLIFSTLPRVFAGVPGGWVFGALFFAALAAAAYLSAVAAFEVLVAGLVDEAGWSRRRATLAVVGGAYLLSLPPTLNLRIFTPWDLAFGTGLQTVGALAAALTVGWALSRSAVLRELAGRDDAPPGLGLLYLWIRWVVPGAILAVGVWWILTAVLGLVADPT
ncbi:MAG: sodium-dependent transporter, partial [Gemmatimonadetes bacterium]